MIVLLDHGDRERRQTNRPVRDNLHWWIAMVATCVACIFILVPSPTITDATGWYFTFNIVRRATDRHILQEEGSGMASTDWESHLCGALVGVVAAGFCSQFQSNVAEQVAWSFRQVLAVGVIFASALYDR